MNRERNGPPTNRKTVRRRFLVAGLLLLAACGSREATSATTTNSVSTESPSATSGTTTSTAEAPATSEPDETVADELDDEVSVVELGELIDGPGPVPLAPGIYQSDVLGPGVALEAEQELVAAFHDGALLVLRRPDWGPEDKAVLILAVALGVMPAEDVGIHQAHDPVVPLATIDIPDDLRSYFEGIPQVTVLDAGFQPDPVLDGEIEWVEFEVNPDGGETFPCPWGEGDCVGLIVGAEGVHAFGTGQHLRVHRIEALPNALAWSEVASESSADVETEMSRLLSGLMTTS